MAYPNDQRNPLAAIPVYTVPAPGGANGTQVVNIPGTDENPVQVKTGPGVFVSLIVGVPASGGSLTIYDGTDASGDPIATLSGEAAAVLPLNLPFTVGLHVVPAGSANYTLVYS